MNVGRGCSVARSISQESRGMIQVSFSGLTSCRSSHRHASIPVLPAPTITYRSRVVNFGSSFGAIQSMPGATEKGAGRRAHRRHDSAQVGGIDDPLLHDDGIFGACEGSELALAPILAHREI